MCYTDNVICISLMSQLPERNPLEHLPEISSTAQVLWEEVIYSLDEFTSDSTLAKFFMPEELLDASRPVAAAFAMLHFSPFPPLKDIYRTRLYSLFLFAITCGTQTYLKEQSRAGTTRNLRFITDPKRVKEIKNSILRSLIDGVSICQPIDEVMSLFLKQLLPMKEQLRLYPVGSFFNEAMYDQFLPITLAWGYLFAKEMTDCTNLLSGSDRE